MQAKAAPVGQGPRQGGWDLAQPDPRRGAVVHVGGDMAGDPALVSVGRTDVIGRRRPLALDHRVEVGQGKGRRSPEPGIAALITAIRRSGLARAMAENAAAGPSEQRPAALGGETWTTTVSSAGARPRCRAKAP
jgi:hypothetical protein